MIQALLWDNDGVLVETEHLYFEATQRVLASVGIDLTREDYIDLFLVQGRGAWHLVEARGASPAEVAELKQRRHALYSQLVVEAPRVIPGVDKVLEALHGRYVMGVVTSSKRDHFDILHASTGFLRYFDFVFTADDVARTKPDPELYLRAIDRAGVPAEACLAIEDSARGLEAATRAGLRCVVVPSGLTQGQRFDGADRVLERLADLVPLLLG